uniref:Small ribosomal subunit protein uS4c n=1 Tax=Selaginella doederleinii TaxID=186426 RepID=A0A482CFR5_9TRAC|nr:ribosomal protein S4 [Selaginella doederleinii]YP_009589498.1 ribosomal protein S4 [Selaginella doederleinii]QBL76032.1 ribosomal protein S4 [Selaginella doederleinii]QBL76080.1 ribosomal protein S4 [Selaginella doederleinii]
MSRHRGPRAKIVRRPGRSPGPTRKRPNKKPGYANQSTPTTKAPQYRIRSEEKQRSRFHHGPTEQQSLRYVRLARRAKGSTGQVSLQSLETRSDNIIPRLGMASTTPGARQSVTHEHTPANDHAINIPSYRRKPTDAIAVRQSCRGGNSSNRIGEQNDSTLYPHAGLAVQPVDRKWIDPNTNESPAVEYHPRQAQ